MTPHSSKLIQAFKFLNWKRIKNSNCFLYYSVNNKENNSNCFLYYLLNVFIKRSEKAHNCKVPLSTCCTYMNLYSNISNNVRDYLIHFMPWNQYFKHSLWLVGGTMNLCTKWFDYYYMKIENVSFLFIILRMCKF